MSHRAGRPGDGRIIVINPSHRSPRADWSRPRSINDVMTALDQNGFLQSSTTVGVAFVRVCGVMALRVTIADRRATLETALREEGQPVRWRVSSDLHRVGSEPWQVAREALELLATLSVDTPVRWG
jgi:hypothetical protein